MAPTVILRNYLSKDSMRLGRLIANPANPEEFFYDPPPAAGQIVTEEQNSTSIDRVGGSSRSFLKKCLGCLSLSYSKQNLLVSEVRAKCSKEYVLDNSREYFRTIIKLPETLEWIETAYKEGGDICLLVGFVTVLDADFKVYNTEFRSSDVSLSILEASLARSVESNAEIIRTSKASGEKVCAVLYQKVKVSRVGRGATLSWNQWEVGTKHRQAQPTETNHVLEANISESTEHDNLEFEDDDDDDQGWTKLVDEGNAFYL